MAGIPRINTTQQTNYYRKHVDFNTPGIANGVLAGTLPAGAMLTRATCRLNVLFNATTTNVLTAGTNSTSYNNIFAAADIAEDTVGGYVAPAITAGATTYAVDTDIFIKYTQTGTAATTGSADFTFEFMPNNDG